jgi:hypothetical protein
MTVREIREEIMERDAAFGIGYSLECVVWVEVDVFAEIFSTILYIKFCFGNCHHSIS